MKRVLLTRPEPGVTRTAGDLARRGYAPLLLPLSRIAPLPVELGENWARFDAVAVTSANAVRHAPAELLSALRNHRTFAVGEATAEECRRLGLDVEDVAEGDAASLGRQIIRQVADDAAVLVLCGHVRRDVLQNALLGAGLRPHLLEIYDTVATTPDHAAIRAVLGAEPVDAVLLYSAFAAREFASLVERFELMDIFRSSDMIVMSERIGATLPEPLRQHLFIAVEPNENAMLFHL